MNPTISVAICTKDHPEDLRRCLASVCGLADQIQEILVVDNNSSTPETRQIAESCGVRYALEPKPGLCAARNCALQNLKADIVAFTDDDCVADRGWITAIRAAFLDPNVGCVTGKAISQPPMNSIQKEYELHSRGFCKDHEVEVKPQTVGNLIHRAMIGVGANMAFRRSLLLSLGAFPTDQEWNNGDDDYIFFKVARAGYRIVYRPDSIVYQTHREKLSEHLRRFFQYGLGSMRVVWYVSAEFHSFRVFLLNFAAIMWWTCLSLQRSLIRLAGVRVLFDLAQLTGLVSGFFSISGFQSVWKAQHAG